MGEKINMALQERSAQIGALTTPPKAFDVGLIRLAISTIFISGLYVGTPIGILYYHYLIMAILYMAMAFRSSSLGLSAPYMSAYALTLFISIVGYFVSSRNYSFSFNGLVPITLKLTLLLFFAAFYTLIYNISGKSTKILFSHYLKVASFFAALGVIQQLIFVATGFNIFADLTARSKNYGSFLGVAALSVEPAFYACALLPAGAFYVSEFVRKLKLNIPAIVVIAALIFSTSSLGYIGLFISIVISCFFMDARRVWILALTIPFALFASYSLVNLEFFQLRLNDTIEYVESGQLTLRRGMNMSTYSNAVNNSIAFKSFTDNFGLGAGIGMYSTVFDRYIFGFELPSYRVSIPGRGSGTSLFARLTAELGILAWGYFAAAFAWAVSNLRRDRSGLAIHIGYMSTMIIILMRMGEYYANGVVLVFLMIYLAHRESRNRVKGSQGSAAGPELRAGGRRLR